MGSFGAAVLTAALTGVAAAQEPLAPVPTPAPTPAVPVPSVPSAPADQPGRGGVELFDSLGRYSPNVTEREMLAAVTRERKRMPFGQQPLSDEDIALIRAQTFRQVKR